MNWIEITATIFGALCVWLTVRQHILCWPTGLVQVLLYIVVFYQAKLYSDMLLHVVYVGLQLYGWYAWLYGGDAAYPHHRPAAHTRGGEGGGRAKRKYAIIIDVTHKEKNHPRAKLMDGGFFIGLFGALLRCSFVAHPHILHKPGAAHVVGCPGSFDGAATSSA